MLLAIVTFAVTASMLQIDSIRIESGWGGLGTLSGDAYRIVRRRVKAAADRAAELYEYDRWSGYASRPRYILPSGEVIEDEP